MVDAEIEPLLPSLTSITQAQNLKNLRRHLNNKHKLVHSILLSNLHNEQAYEIEIRRLERAERK